MFENSLLIDDHDVRQMRELLELRGSSSTIVDFDEQISLPAIWARTRIWRQENRIIGFAFVDDFDNLWFEAESNDLLMDELEAEMIQWGVMCLQQPNGEEDAQRTLDSTCSADNRRRIHVLKKHGFTCASVRTLLYERPLDQPIVNVPLPTGFSIRSVAGRQEVEQLVALHQAAFGTKNMSVEYRLAMMNSPQYAPELDLVAVAPNGELSAFCVCGFDDIDKKIGCTDPIGTHLCYQKLGLGKALLSSGLRALQKSGAQIACLGTSSENIPMQRLASALGFKVVSEKLWFSKDITQPSHA